MKQVLILCFLLSSFFSFSQFGEEAGSASYYYKNNSLDTLIIQIVMVAQLGNKADTVISYPGEKTLLFEDGIFGVNPMPSDTFKSISIKTSNDAFIYQEEKLTNTNWKRVKDETDTSDYYHCDYYLQPDLRE